MFLFDCSGPRLARPRAWDFFLRVSFLRLFRLAALAWFGLRVAGFLAWSFFRLLRLALVGGAGSWDLVAQCACCAFLAQVVDFGVGQCFFWRRRLVLFLHWPGRAVVPPGGDVDPVLFGCRPNVGELVPMFCSIEVACQGSLFFVCAHFGVPCFHFSFVCRIEFGLDFLRCSFAEFSIFA